MKKQKMTENDFRKMEYEFSEYKDDVPTELSELLGRAIDLLRPYFYYELPLSRELPPLLEKLMYDQYPAFRECKQSWQSGWISEISKQTADVLADDITSLFVDIEAGENLTALYDNFDKQVEFYARPHHPKQRSVSDYVELPLTNEEKLKIVSESYEEEKAECDQHNLLQSAFINAVQPTIFKYFGDRTDNMNIEMWNHYGIAMGFAFYRFNDDCVDMECALEYDDLVDHPGMSFYEYNKMVKDNFEVENKKLTEQYEQIKNTAN